MCPAPDPTGFPAPRSPFLDRWLSGRRGLAWLLIVGAALFCTYATFRQRYIWGCDSYGYYAFGKLISEGRAHLPVEYPPGEFPAGIPLAFSINAKGVATPDYPPGLPLLLAIGHLLHAPLFVTPAVGVISCGLLFLLIRRRASVETAALFALAWAFLPVTVFGSTMLMSDLVAAAALMAACLAFGSNRLALAAWALGFAFWVRPTNVLFLIPFSVMLPFDRRTVKLAANLLVPCSLYALYNHLQFGAPWKTGYGDVGLDFLGTVFWPHVRFYAWQSVLVLSPFIVALVIAGLRPWSREKFFLLLWALEFFLFYCFWGAGGEGRWWWTRFLLPAYPPLFMLAADGFEKLRGRLRTVTANGWRHTGQITLWLLLAFLPVYYVAFGIHQKDLWNRDTGTVNYEVIRRVKDRVPGNSVVGSVEFTGALTLYSTLTPFFSTHPNAPEFVARALADGRRAFVLVEPWNATDPVMKIVLARFDPVPVDHFDFLWGGLPFYELKIKNAGRAP